MQIPSTTQRVAVGGKGSATAARPCLRTQCECERAELGEDAADGSCCERCVGGESAR